MNSFIYHAIMMLEDMGMSVGYPDFHHATVNNDGSKNVHMKICERIGNRVSIEQNQKMKFMMIFSIFDVYIDSCYPELEGLSFLQKYKNIPSDNDMDLILSQLFRIAKLIRNSIIHSPSSFEFSNSNLNVEYKFRGTNFFVELSFDALNTLYTAIVMYTKGDLGSGNYFLGIMRYIFSNIISGISRFSDEFGTELKHPDCGIKIKPYLREVVMNTEYEVKDGEVKIKFDESKLSDWQGADFYIERNGEDFLVPIEALGTDLTIEEAGLMSKWRYEGSFPPLNKNL
ncbi:hypothetical protein [Marinobacterium iners]|uniref:Uncharacterized protein n=1 Tax=Marinobacterium iners DSM 11526 TaxID=1122198 RepID=A0A1H4E7M3_9GAMM|nr:hypothetical protein [Marinobacterium iners]SEA80728.1 hypothetical protein SAMN02745729_107180 [Marinobacterium iners DSM 11526]